MTWGRFSVEQMPAVDRHVPAGPADFPFVVQGGRAVPRGSELQHSQALTDAGDCDALCSNTSCAKAPAAIAVSGRAETRAQVVGPELVEGPGRPAETHQVQEQLRRIPL
jgi:hypothetical protein